MLLLLAGYAGAEESVTIEKTVVTATRTETKIKDVPASVEIVTAEEIRNMEGSTVTEILKFSTGINFYDSMLRTTPSIRGFDGKHTLLLIDGKRVAGPLGKFSESDRISTENIEKIEIIRGPMSTLYGSEAMGGVINIITKKPDKITMEAGTKYGAYDSDTSFNETYFNLTLGGEKFKDFGFTLSGQTLHSDSFPGDGRETLSPEKSLKSISSKFTYQFTDALSSEANISYLEDETYNQIFSKFLKSSENDFDRFDSSLDVKYNTHKINALIRGYYSRWNKDYESRYLEDYTSRGTLHSSGELQDFNPGQRKTTVVEGLVTKPMGSHILTLGGEWRREFHHSSRMDTGHNNFTAVKEGLSIQGSECEPDNYALYLQDEWSLGSKLLIIPGIRYDIPDDFDKEISPKLGITYFIHPAMRMKFNYGHSFRAPGPGELYKDWYGMGGRVHLIGNNELKPEKSNSYEIALEGEKEKFSGRAAYFYNEVTDLIDSEFIENEGPSVKAYNYININEATIQGVEIEADYMVTKGLSLKAGYSYLDARDKSSDQRLEQRPRETITAKLFYSNKKYDFDLNLWGEYTEDYKEDDKNYNFTMINLNAKKRFTNKLELYAGVDNLLDKKEEDLHKTILGTSLYCGVRVKF